MKSKGRSYRRKFPANNLRRALRRLATQASQLASAGDDVAVETLWLEFNGLARQLAKLVDGQQSALDHERLTDVLVRCQHILKVALAHRDAAALCIVATMATKGCELLRQTTTHDQEFVASYAEKEAFWPVMMARKRMYHKDTDKYLESIRVGTKSVPPTAPRTNVEATDRWTELATMLVEKMVLYRAILLRDKDRIEWSGPVMQRAEQEIRIGEAKDFQEVMDLRSERDGTIWLNRDTKTKWWKIAKRMLKAYWRANPEQAQQDFASVSAVLSESKEAYATRCVRKAFYSLAVAGRQFLSN